MGFNLAFKGLIFNIIVQMQLLVQIISNNGINVQFDDAHHTLSSRRGGAMRSFTTFFFSYLKVNATKTLCATSETSNGN